METKLVKFQPADPNQLGFDLVQQVSEDVILATLHVREFIKTKKISALLKVGFILLEYEDFHPFWEQFKAQFADLMPEEVTLINENGIKPILELENKVLEGKIEDLISLLPKGYTTYGEVADAVSLFLDIIRTEETAGNKVKEIVKNLEVFASAIGEAIDLVDAIRAAVDSLKENPPTEDQP